MIVQMETGVGESHPHTLAIVEKAQKNGLRAEIVLTKGTQFSVVEIYLKDTEKVKAGMFPEFIFERMPGVSNVRRVTPSMVSLATNGEYHRVKLGSVTFGQNYPCQLIAGPCTVDIHTPELIKQLSLAGVRIVRGGCFKPRSKAGSYPGPREKGLRILFDSAAQFGIEAVFTEVMDTRHIDMVNRAIENSGFKGTVVLWIGARTRNQELFTELGRQKVFPVMVKNGLNENIEEWIDKVAWLLVGEKGWNLCGQLLAEKSLEQGNDQIFLCVRGLGRPRHDKSRLRGIPNLHWIGDVQEKYWPPVGCDVSHFTGSMQDDLVLKYLEAALLLEKPAFILLEVKLDDIEPVCDADQAVPLSRLAEVQDMVSHHNKKHFSKEK